MSVEVIALVGSETLLGREIRERAPERGITAELQLISAGGQVLSAEEEEAVLLTELTQESLEEADVIVLAGSPESSRRALVDAPSTSPIIDATAVLEDMPEARFTAEPAGARALRIVPHPAAIALARILRGVQSYRTIRHAVVLVFEPASERGQAGISELQQQTSSLLSFRPLDKAVFDAQLSFNMLPRYGSEAPLSLESVELKIERHLATLLQGAVALPSLRLVQSPVFHGHSFSLWIQFEEAADPAELAEALAAAGLDVRANDLEPPTNVGAAGQHEVTVGVIEADRNHPRAVWLWAVTDNLRIAADATLDIVSEVSA